MADDVEAALSAMEDNAPLTEDVEELETGGEETGAEDEGSEGEQQPQRAKLPPEEIEKRWQQTKQALKLERRQRAEDLQRYEERFASALEKLTPKQEQRLENKLDLDGIDPDADPLAALKALAGVVKGYQGEVRKQQEVQTQEQARTQAEKSLISRIDQDAREFAEDVPDYYDGQAHYVNARFAMLENAGFTKDEASNAIKYEMLQIAAKALQGGRNPAEAIYNSAKAIGYGYKPAAPKGDERITQIKDGSKTASKMNGGGSGNTSGLSFKAIASLKGAAFDAAMEKVIRG
jgi:hypothetical protein